MKTPALVAAISGAASIAAASPRYLAPAQDINLPSSESATSPLEWLGANSPWFAGPNVFGISSEVPQGCEVEQAAYVVRHGSRYPDPGAYSGWVDMYERFQAGNYTAHGSLKFMRDWKPTVTNPDIQLSKENPTGYKESYDLGYTLRTRYPDLYQEGQDFLVWSNNYTRVLQTAQMFTRGFLGTNATVLGKLISVTSRGFAESVGNSLGPSDGCPNFKDGNGGTQREEWTSIYVPPIQSRLQALIDGDLELRPDDVTRMPYLCGYESAITGRLSPWCDVFTDEELKDYEYDNTLRYYYGIGPGTELQSTMMLPYLNELVQLFSDGPNVTGKSADGGQYTVPKILMSFLNDGQLNELVAASGVFDAQPPLSGTSRDEDRLFYTSRFGTMRGTIAFEVLNCKGGVPTSKPKSRCHHEDKSGRFVRIRLNDAVYPVPSCKNGPGSSCPLTKYIEYVKDKYAAAGDWAQNCNVTMDGVSSPVRGAAFFTDLSGDYLQVVEP